MASQQVEVRYFQFTGDNIEEINTLVEVTPDKAIPNERLWTKGGMAIHKGEFVSRIGLFLWVMNSEEFIENFGDLKTESVE